MMQSYTYAGDFTIQGKIKTALYENALWYASYLVIFVGLMLYVIFHPGSHLDGYVNIIVIFYWKSTENTRSCGRFLEIYFQGG